MKMSDAIKLYDFATSPNCQRVKVVLEEKGLDYETVPHRPAQAGAEGARVPRPEPLRQGAGAGGRRHGALRVVHHQQYLEDKYPDPPLLPADPSARARIRILIDYGINHTNDSIRPSRPR